MTMNGLLNGFPSMGEAGWLFHGVGSTMELTPQKAPEVLPACCSFPPARVGVSTAKCCCLWRVKCLLGSVWCRAWLVTQGPSWPRWCHMDMEKCTRLNAIDYATWVAFTHGKFHLEMDDDWAFPPRIWNLQVITSWSLLFCRASLAMSWWCVHTISRCQFVGWVDTFIRNLVFCELGWGLLSPVKFCSLWSQAI